MLYDIMNLIRRPAKKCGKCRNRYTSKDLQIIVSDLKWEQKNKQAEKTTRGHLDVSGGINYVEFTQYKVYYRLARFFYTCPKCGEKYTWGTRYDLYDGRWGHSQSSNEEVKLLKTKISFTLGQELWNDGNVRINVSHEL